MIKKIVQNLLHKELSYTIHGAAIEVRKDFGPGHKEKLYQKAFAEELKRRKIKFEQEKAIKIYSPKDGKYIGLYRPDFIVENKIIVEMKAEKFVSREEIKRIYDYLRNSEYELAYFINFASSKLFVRRIIYTNDRKYSLKKTLVCISSILVLIGGLMFSNMAKAATLYLEPATASYQRGETFTQEIRVNVDNQNENLNAFSIYLNYPADFLKVKDVNLSNSIISFTVTEPVVDEKNGIISLAGIVPGGYGGRVIGDPGLTNLIAKIIFEVKQQENLSADKIINIQFDKKTAVLLNDGKGTPANLSNTGSQLTILKEGIIGEGQEEVTEESDKMPPEISQIEISRSPDLFNNQWFIVFSAVDKDSGVASYQIQENKNNQPDEDNWLNAKSPFLLNDQELKSYIFVQAIDRAGNKKLIVKSPQIGYPHLPNYILYIIIIVLVSIGVFIVFKVVVNVRRRNKNETRV